MDYPSQSQLNYFYATVLYKNSIQKQKMYHVPPFYLLMIKLGLKEMVHIKSIGMRRF